MKFRCPACKQIITRDMRDTAHQGQMTKRGYESYCTVVQKTVYMKPIKSRRA